MYACESWTLTAELQRRIQAMEMRCCHKILHTSYEDLVTNKEVRAKIQQAIRPHEDLLTTVKRNWKLKQYGHVSCSSGSCSCLWWWIVMAVEWFLSFVGMVSYGIASRLWNYENPAKYVSLPHKWIVCLSIRRKWQQAMSSNNQWGFFLLFFGQHYNQVLSVWHFRLVSCS